MKKHGFTLIELLAVIVILAIVALIAVPLISNVIQDSKESALKTNMKNYARALEDAVVLGQMGITSSTTEINSDVYEYTEITNINGVSFTGEKPSDGWVAFDSDLTVIAAMLYFEGINASKYVIYYYDKIVVNDYTSGNPSTIGEKPATVAEAITNASSIVNPD